ncbi:MAG: hypothetical protein M0Z75_07380 [Nitrospiraceae bacterium]|nr:hypothetical protein [Nitrospiraceae bacterium]
MIEITVTGIERSADGPCMVCTITDGISRAELTIAIEGGQCPVKYRPVSPVNQTITAWLETHTLREVLEAVPEAARAEALYKLREFYQKERAGEDSA